MKKTLFIELARMSLLSIAIFAALFGVLYLVELFVPSMQGVLLQWNSPAFVVGIPASICGVAYVLTIRNPRNYTGFYLGIVMAILLAVQFYFQGNYDLVVLYACLFAPFILASLLRWRRATLHPSDNQEDTEEIAFLNMRPFLITIALHILIIAADYALITLVLNHDGWADQVCLKLLSGAMISTAVMANFWMIYKKNDAWINWVLYSLVGIAFYIMINNAFSLILFVVFLLVNGQAMIVWIRDTKKENYGWLHR